jgi:hypothetical protein
MKIKYSLFLLFAFVFQPLSASYLSIGESGEILPANTPYQMGLAPQLVTNNVAGGNLSTFLDKAWTDSLSSRFTLGLGVIDFFTGASLKYIPFPDVDNQPALGVKASFWHAREETENISTLQIAPMMSKKFQSQDHGLFTPYTAIGMSSFEVGGKGKNGLQFFVGSEWKPVDLPEYNFTAEVALDLEDSVSHITLFVGLPFSEKSGF